MQKRLLLVSIGWLLCSAITGQNLTTRNITLEQAIEIAHARSPQVQIAQLNFIGTSVPIRHSFSHRLICMEIWETITAH